MENLLTSSMAELNENELVLVAGGQATASSTITTISSSSLGTISSTVSQSSTTFSQSSAMSASGPSGLSSQAREIVERILERIHIAELGDLRLLISYSKD